MFLSINSKTRTKIEKPGLPLPRVCAPNKNSLAKSLSLKFIGQFKSLCVSLRNRNPKRPAEIRGVGHSAYLKTSSNTAYTCTTFTFSTSSFKFKCKF